jgi:serine/threonine-protein kinase
MSRADDGSPTDGLDGGARLGGPPDPRIGTELAGYRIQALLGRGGTSVVYLAEQARPRRSVALKLLLPEVAASRAFQQRFLREQELAASIDHPNVLPVYDAGEAGGVLWIAMRYVEGTDLRVLLAQRGPPPWEAVAIVAQVASALDAAHTRGLVHRDVKPGNILLAGEAGGIAHAYLADFGLTRQLDAPSGLTASGQMVGTVDYCAPEQVQGRPLDGRADQYALACVLFECLTGAVPFRRPTELATAWAQVHDRPPRLADVRAGLPRAMEPVLARGLAKRPADRYPTCTDLATAARDALGGTAARGLAVRMAWRRIVRPWRRRTVRLVLALAVAVLAGALASAGLLLRSNPNADQPPAAPVVAPGTAVRIDAATGQVTKVVHVGGAPAAVATGSGLAWVADRHDATVWVIDPATGQVQSKIPGAGPVPAGPGGPAIAFQDESAWVVTSGHKSVNLIDANTKKPHPININALPSSVAVGGDTVLVAEAAVGKVDIIDTIGSTPRPLKVGQAPSGVALTPNGLTGWVVDRKDQKLVKVDTQTAKVVQQIDLPLPPEQVTRSGDDVLWITNSSTGQVMRVDSRAARPKVELIQVGNGPTGIAYGLGRVWVADSNDTTVSFIDTDQEKNPDDGYDVATLQLGFRPTAVAVDAQTRSVWVTVSA